MKTVALTQRVDIVSSERRDSIDQKWFDFLLHCKLRPLLIPNNLELAKIVFNTIDFDGIILSGGNDLIPYGGNAPERDEIELYVLKLAIKKNIPLLGICRGMELIQHYFGIQLLQIAGHAGNMHEVKINGSSRKVNSYHDLGTDQTSNELEILALASDGIIESIAHKRYPIKGIMWHPERNAPFLNDDINFVKELFGVN